MAEPNNEYGSLNAPMKGGRKRAGRSSDSPNGAPSGTCKLLMKRCVNGCIFAPYFGPEQRTALFAAVHKIFGPSNVSKLLVQLPLHHHYSAVKTLTYEAQARLADPVSGCVSVVAKLITQAHASNLCIFFSVIQFFLNIHLTFNLMIFVTIGCIFAYGTSKGEEANSRKTRGGAGSTTAARTVEPP
ncbi:putative transcription factor AS2-LOB family [Helianthus debilis subsp. tardiflorus]